MYVADLSNVCLTHLILNRFNWKEFLVGVIGKYSLRVDTISNESTRNHKI